MNQAAYTIERYTNRTDWLRARKRGLGASDAPCVLGMGRWKGAYSIATDKLTTAIDESDGDEMLEWGRRHEPAIAQKLLEVLKERSPDFDLVDPGEFTIYRSTRRPHLFCTPDRLVTFRGEVVAEASLKCAWYEGTKEWASTVPLGYQVQNQQTMYVIGLEMSYFAALLNGYSFKWHKLPRRNSFLAKMIPKLDAFWASIQRGEYPNVDGSEATARSLAARYGNPKANMVELPPDFETLGSEYDAILEQDHANDKRKLLIANTIKDALGNNTVGVLPDQSGFSWKMNGKGRRFSRVEKVNVE